MDTQSESARVKSDVRPGPALILGALLPLLGGCATPVPAPGTYSGAASGPSRDWGQVTVPHVSRTFGSRLATADPQLEAEIEPGLSIAVHADSSRRPGGLQLHDVGFSRESNDVRAMPVSEFCAGRPSLEPVAAFSFCDDLRAFPDLLRDDTRSLFTTHNAVFAGGALALALGLRADADDKVRDWTAEHPRQWGGFSKALRTIGATEYQIPVIAAVYGCSLKRHDRELQEMSSALFSAYTINGILSLAIKGIADTERPTNTWVDGRYGFPSGHASTTFTIASVLDEYYGGCIGVPAYAVAGLVGWGRIDARDHDASDVVFGAALGYVIGKSVARNHRWCENYVQVSPWVDGNVDLGGIMVATEF